MRLLEQLNAGLVAIEAQGLRRRRRVVASPCGPRQMLIDPVSGQERQNLNFCSNDYLGLAGHPALAQSMAQGAQQYGTGSGGSHLILGHSHAHSCLERHLADWQRPYIPKADALFFCSGYMANIAVLTVLGTAQAEIFSDNLNHASLIDGSRLARAAVQRYPHRDLATLDTLLQASAASVKIIVSDTVFSMDGCLADTAGQLELAERHDAWLVLDDAHGFGVLGAQGRGALEHANVCSHRIVYVGTLGKAAGVAGAFVAAHATVVAHLIQHARTYIYTTAAPPAVAHTVMASLTLMEGTEGQVRRGQLAANIEQFRRKIKMLLPQNAETYLVDSDTAVQPLIVGDNERVLRLAASLQARNILVGAIRPPTVPIGSSRLRITLSAAHTPEDIDQLVSALCECLSDPETV